MFQCTNAVITPALVVGGFAERMKFSVMLAGGLRVNADEETEGLDIVSHDERGYNL